MLFCHTVMTQALDSKMIIAPPPAPHAVKAPKSWLVRGESGAKAEPITSAPTNTFIIEPQPKLSGGDRHAAERAKARKMAGSESLMWMSVALLHGAMKKRIVSTTAPRHLSMLDPFIPHLLATIQRTKIDRILVVVLRILPSLFPLPFQALNRTAKDFSKCVLTLVHNNTRVRATEGRSELADCALRAFTSMLRHCKLVQVCACV